MKASVHTNPLWETGREYLLSRSVKVGTEITLASGRVSDFYVDTKQSSISAQGAYLLGTLMAELMLQVDPAIQVVAGPTLGADPLITATLLALRSRGYTLEGIIVRKEAKGHGTGAWLEGAAHVPAGARVAVIEDVVTTGGSGLKAIEKLQSAGYLVQDVFAVVDREEGGELAISNAGLRLHALYTQSDLRSGGSTPST